MKTRTILLIIGIVTFVFGFTNLILYLPDFGIVNTPFPFQEIQSINHAEDVDGVQMATVTSHSIASALQMSPYWFSWSLALYIGVALLGIFGIETVATVKRKRK